MLELVKDKFLFGGESGEFYYGKDPISPIDHDELLMVFLKCAMYIDYFKPIK